MLNRECEKAPTRAGANGATKEELEEKQIENIIDKNLNNNKGQRYD